MRCLRLGAILAVAFLCGVAPQRGVAGETPATVVRAGTHTGFGRLVFDLPAGASFDVVSEGDRMLLVFKGAGALTGPATPPRNVVSVLTGRDSATLVLAQGARARPTRLGSRLVIDVFDPVRPVVPGPPAPERGRTAGPPVQPAAQARAAPPPAPAPAEAPASGAADRAGAGTVPAPVVPVTRDELPAPSPPAASPGVEAAAAPDPMASPAPAAAAPPPPGARPALIRAEADVGAAAFRRGEFGLVVLDRRITPSAVPPGAVWTAGAVSMVLQIPLPSTQALRLLRVPAGWTVETVDAPAEARMAPVTTPDGTAFPLARPGRVVAILDPVTGGTLLVGSSLGSGPETALAEGRRSPDFTVLPTWLGVAVEPSADRVELRATQAAFVLVGIPVAPGEAGAAPTRRFDLPDQPAPALLNRLQAQLAGAATAAPRARSRERVAAAQTMLALGLGAEEQSLMQLVAAEDPQAAADAEVVGLAAMGALLAGRLGESAGLDDPRLDGSDEISLWRGIRDRQLGLDSPAARGLADKAALVRAYPPTLRRHLWPAVAEAQAQSAVPLSEGALKELPPLARALRLERDGKVDDALAAYDAAAAGPDRLAQTRGTALGAELRLAAGRITPAEAAAVLERQAFAWRGDAREAALRLRAAELRGVAREWQTALEALKQTEALFPEQHAAAQLRRGAVLHAMLMADGGALSPFELVMLASQYADGVPEGPEGGALARLLAEKLLALDLPARAIPLLQGLMRAAPAGEPRAEFGLRLAQLLLDGADPAGAQVALDASAAANLSPALREARGLAMARAQAAAGHVAEAAAGLFELGTEAADDLRGALLAQAGDWRGCLGALADLAAKRVPAEGPLTEAAQDVLLREASAAAQIPDGAALQVLARSAPRMSGPRGDLFRVLTAAPLRTAADLPRTAKELALARNLPVQLGALAAH